MRSNSLGVFAHHSIAPTRNRWFADSLVEGDGFELSVPRQRRHPSVTANRLSRHHFPRNLGLRSPQKASPPSRNPSELPRKVAGSSQRPPPPAAGTRRCLVA